MAQLVNLATEDRGSILRTYVKKLNEVAHAYNRCTEEAETGLLGSQLAYLVSSRPVRDSIPKTEKKKWSSSGLHIHAHRQGCTHINPLINTHVYTHPIEIYNMH